MSQFLKDTDEYSADVAGIDFDDAVKLSGGGSTCDIYKTRWQRRDVFVKRLKEEYRAKPLYLDAFDKEFEVGVGLRHPSLPEYREFHRDYIIMDYIDGDTLAGMIKRKDSWLTEEKNIVTMLRELVDVVDYLHRHNVVHCDIKPDNIMITANTRNLVLIDFDKSYTYALGDTSGHPAKYGLTTEEKGRVAIDFRGIGMIVEKLKSTVPGFKLRSYRQFVKACRSADVNCEELREILDAARTTVHSRSISNKLAIIIATAMISIGLLIGVIGYWFTSAPRTQAEIHEDARKKAAALDQRISPSFDELLVGLDRLNALINDTSVTGPQLLDSIRRHSDIADEYIVEAAEILNEMYPGLTEREKARIMSYSQAYTGYTRRATPELREYGHEIERRYRAEGLTLP